MLRVIIGVNKVMQSTRMVRMTGIDGLEELRGLQQQVEDYIKEEARRQGLEGNSKTGFQMSPKEAVP